MSAAKHTPESSRQQRAEVSSRAVRLYCEGCPRVASGYAGCNLHDLCARTKVNDYLGRRAAVSNATGSGEAA